MDRLYKPLQERISGVVYTPDQFLAEHTTNFGHIVHVTPRFVVEPAGVADVVAAVRFALDHRLHVSTRGAGHSQSHLGVSDGGILLSMGSMNRILAVDEHAGTADVEGGTVWRDLVHHTKRFELYPNVLTNNLVVPTV